MRRVRERQGRRPVRRHGRGRGRRTGLPGGWHGIRGGRGVNRLEGNGGMGLAGVPPRRLRRAPAGVPRHGELGGRRAGQVRHHAHCSGHHAQRRNAHSRRPRAHGRLAVLQGRGREGRDHHPGPLGDRRHAEGRLHQAARDPRDRRQQRPDPQPGRRGRLAR